MKTATRDIILTQGLDGQGDKIDVLMELWDDLLTSSAEVAQAPCPDMFSFATNAFYFAVISAWKEKQVTISSDSENAGVGPSSRLGDGSRSAENRGNDRGYDVGEPITKVVHFSNSGPGNSASPTTTPQKSSGELFAQLHWDSVGVDNNLDDVAANITPFPHTDDDYPMIPSTNEVAGNTNHHLAEPVGIVFIVCSPNTNGPSGELSIGVVLHKDHRNKGLARQAVQLVMRLVFDDLNFHRLQAVILECPRNDRAMTLFTQLGFGHEGTRRRSVYSHVDMSWKDATYLAMLDTDWFNRLYFKPAPKSLWDEMFLRHERERQELLRWQDGTPVGLKRTMSMETVCVGSGLSNPSASVASCKLQSDNQEDNLPGPSDTARGKRKLWSRPRTRSPYPSSRSDSETSSDAPLLDDIDDFEGKHTELDMWRHRVTSVPPSSASGRSPSPRGSIISQWDLLETSSADGSLHFESPGFSDDE